MILLQTHKTKSFSKGTNEKKYIVVHHTGGSEKGDLERLCNSGKVSCHFYINKRGKIYELADCDKITRHAGTTRHECKNQNSIGIEIESKDGKEFTQDQVDACIELLNFLVQEHNIKNENILRHADISSFRGKRDVGPNFFSSFGTRKDFIDKNIKKMNDYKLDDKDVEAINLCIKIMKAFYKKHTPIQQNVKEIANKLRDIAYEGGVSKDKILQ